MTAIKILFSHVQIVSIAASFKLKWPDVLVRFFDSLSAVSSISADVLSLDCMISEARGDHAGAQLEPVNNTQVLAGSEHTQTIAAIGEIIGAGGHENTSLLDWPHAQADDIKVLSDSLAVRETMIMDAPTSESVLAFIMPHGSTYFVRTFVILLSPVVLILGLTLFWVAVDMIDGCLYESQQEEGGGDERNQSSKSNNWTSPANPVFKNGSHSRT